PASALRDASADALLPAQAGRAPRPADAVGDAHPLPLQGRRFLLQPHGEREDLPELRLVLPGAAARDPQDREPALLLQREGRPLRRRRAAREAAIPICMTGGAVSAGSARACESVFPMVGTMRGAKREVGPREEPQVLPAKRSGAKRKSPFA